MYGLYTKSPDKFDAQWDEMLGGDIHKRALTNFQSLKNPSLLALLDGMNPETLQDLGTDHRTFIGLLRIVLTGKVDKQFVEMSFGPIVHSKFTTTETRFIRCWLSTQDPSFEQTRITRYIVYVWAETFLSAKMNNRMQDGSSLLLLELLLTRKYCSSPEVAMLKKSMDFNGQYAHHESILVSLVSSPKAEERRLGVETIFRIREEGPKKWKTPTGQRPFV